MKLYGKDRIKQRLDDIALQNRLPHAILFSGHSGIGKKTLARYAAQLFLCGNNACGECVTCRNIENDCHPDVMFVKRQCGGKYAMEQFREVIRGTVILPNNGDLKVYVFEECDTMLSQHLNSLLKLIEEPAKHLRFVFTCENTGTIPETIMSRVTEFEVPDTSISDCMRYLADSGVDSAQAESLSEMFAGNIGKCCAVLDGGDEGELINAARTAAAAIGARDYLTAAAALAKYQSHRPEFGMIVEYLSYFFRDAMALKAGCEAEFFGKRESLKIAENYSEQEILNMLDAACEVRENEIYNLNLGLTGAYFISRILPVGG